MKEVKMKINYNDIDKECRDMVKFFNDESLTTKYSCAGHDNDTYNSFYIIFGDLVTDNHILLFLEKYSNKHMHTPFIGKFVKWMRKVEGSICSNWKYEVSYGNYKSNQKYAKEDLKIMKQLK